jgi:hypothetical protein
MDKVASRRGGSSSEIMGVCSEAAEFGNSACLGEARAPQCTTARAILGRHKVFSLMLLVQGSINKTYLTSGTETGTASTISREHESCCIG